MDLTINQLKTIEIVRQTCLALFDQMGISVEVRADFDAYGMIRRVHGERCVNQAFDPRHVEIGADDFWLLAKNNSGEPLATYCLRRFVVDDFYQKIRSLALWFSDPPRLADRRFVVDCPIPPFGGDVAHGGGLWIRSDYRGFSRLAGIMPRFARIIALRRRPFDHDSAMIRDDPADPTAVAERKAAYMGRQIYGFARVYRFVNGWFPPEGRNAIMHLCHATRAEAIASLLVPPSAAGSALRPPEFRKAPLVDQDHKPVHAPAVLSQRQEQPRV